MMKALIYNPITGESRWEEDPPKSADLVEVVRCKDCKWWADVDGATKKIGLGACCCGNRVMRLGFLTTKGWFCADGERKDDV